MKGKTGKVNILTGGRNNGRIIKSYLDIQKWAVKNGFEKVKVNFVTSNEKLQQENQELKKQLEIGKEKLQEELSRKTLQFENQQKEFIEYLENEKNRLAKECSHTYEDSLGKLLYVNEDIFNEVNKILSKYKEIIGGK